MAIDVQGRRGQTQIEIEALRDQWSERFDAPLTGRVDETFRRPEQRSQRDLFGGQRAGDRRSSADRRNFQRALESLLTAGQRRFSERQSPWRNLDVRRDRKVVGGENGGRRPAKERGKRGHGRD